MRSNRATPGAGSVTHALPNFPGSFRVVPMPAAAPRDSVLAVIGDGFGSLIVQSTAIYLGFKPQELAIFGPSESPVDTYQQFAYNLGQTVLRSESESHFLPADWPTFAEIDAVSHRSPEPLYRSIRRRYNPGVSEILTEATVVARDLGWDDVRVPTRVGWLQREGDKFVLYDEDANFLGRAKHVMLALGHGPLALPPVLARAKADPALADNIVHAYESKQYAKGGRYVVLGAGIASINEWSNILAAGGSVLALTRNPIPDEQDLNVPRCLFEAQGIDIYQGLDFDQRLEFLGNVLKGTTPRRRVWLEQIKKGRAEGRFEGAIGEVDAIAAGPAGLQLEISSKHGADLGTLDVTGLVAGTGFNKSALTIPLLRRMIEHYDLPVDGGKVELLTNCGVPKLDRPDSRLSMMGLTANSVVPHGDTIAGLKYIGRRFVADCARAEQLRMRPLLSRLRTQVSLAKQTARELRAVAPTRQLT